MPITITNPQPNSPHDLNTLVQFQGTAAPPITKVKLIADNLWRLGSNDVTSGNWSFSYAFNTGGARRIKAEGLDNSNTVIERTDVVIRINPIFTPQRLADIAETEAGMNYKYPDMVKYTTKFNPVFDAFTNSNNYEWCATFVTWCCKKAGLQMPAYTPGQEPYTFALCKAWQQWAISRGYYHDNNSSFSAQRGDIVLYDWEGRNIPDTDWENHIGILLTKQNNIYTVAEGNVGSSNNLLSMTDIKRRTSPQYIQGFISLPDNLQRVI